MYVCGYVCGHLPQKDGMELNVRRCEFVGPRFALPILIGMCEPKIEAICAKSMGETRSKHVFEPCCS